MSLKRKDGCVNRRVNTSLHGLTLKQFDVECANDGLRFASMARVLIIEALKSRAEKRKPIQRGGYAHD